MSALASCEGGTARWSMIGVLTSPVSVVSMIEEEEEKKERRKKNLPGQKLQTRMLLSHCSEAMVDPKAFTAALEAQYPLPAKGRPLKPAMEETLTISPPP